MSEKQKIVHPFTGDESMVSVDSLHHTTDYGLVFRVKGRTDDVGDLNVVVYTSTLISNGGSNQQIHIITEDPQTKVLTQNLIMNNKFNEDKTFTPQDYFVKYLPTWEGGMPTHIHFSDCKLEVIKFIGTAYTNGYTNSILYPCFNKHMYMNRELEYHIGGKGEDYKYEFYVKEEINLNESFNIVEVKKVIE